MLKRFANLTACGGAVTVSTADSRSQFRWRSRLSQVVWRSWGGISRQLRGMATLETLNFDNKALRDLPVDPNPDNRQRTVSGACFSKVKPTPVKKPQLVVCSPSALQLLDLPPSEVQRPDFADFFGGNKLLPGSQPAAHCYCGHQFGSFAGQLGDGATMYLGEVVNKAGERWEIQFKGAGLTPYSRTADGRKVLRSSLREFLCSEAIHNLGIPTTRAGTCVTSDSKVIRDIFYSGNPKEERCTIILRIAQTFIRFGSFEIFKPADEDTGRQGPSVGQTDLLRKLLDYTVSTFYPEIWQKHEAGEREQMYEEMFREVVARTARLVAHWQCVGWCHGVLNTDNMSITGVTIDYGPFGFMDKYDPQFICNGSDDGGRYTYEKQPEMCKWNCGKLAEAIQGAVPLEKTKAALETFDEEFSKHYTAGMRKKLGLLLASPPEDKELVEGFLNTMEETGADFTNSFRCLSGLPLPSSPGFESQRAQVLEYLLTQCCTLEDMRKACAPRMDPRQLQMMMMLIQTNPDLLQALGSSFGALGAELERVEKLKELEKETQAGKASRDRSLWEGWLNKYKERLQLEVDLAKGSNLSLEEANRDRTSAMDSSNPRVVLRNYIAQTAIEAAERGDFSQAQHVLDVLQRPYDAASPQETTATATATAGAAKTGDGAGGSAVESCGEASHSQRATALDSKPPAWSTELRVT